MCSSRPRRVVVNDEKSDLRPPWKLGEKVSAEGYISYGLHQVVHTSISASHGRLLLHLLTLLPEHWLSPVTEVRGKLPVQMFQVTSGGFYSLLNTQESRVDTGNNSRGKSIL